MGNKRMVEVTDWEIKHHTETAILVTDGDTEIWIPLSLVEELAGYEGEDLDEEIEKLESFTVPEWIAIQKGLI